MYQKQFYNLIAFLLAISTPYVPTFFLGIIM
ncbi:hypothetical protein HNQ80_004262 [Anaerosolibacter carboniphilus]|uniref:Uncharacterized protein n=1 Tax=Anaerosolibacter carboniphilus TaxID=1417629 RepID=A0A841L4T0_9FIRM|nr:hypothetical protein [Anaerosolibacter carboniphilus]